MYFKGNFWKNGLNKPKYKFDINPQVDDCEKGDATNLPLENEALKSIILDPPFLFGVHGKTKEYYSSHTIFNTFDDLYITYMVNNSQAFRVKEQRNIDISMSKTYTDSGTTMTHDIVYTIATCNGFYAKDIAILVKPNKIYNGNTKQRHLRKIHTYFWVFEES